MKYSKRNHRKLKPNRAQRERAANGIACQSWRPSWDNPMKPEHRRATEKRARDERREAAERPIFSDRRGVSYRREKQGNGEGFTVLRKGFRPVDKKRSERAQRLGKTLNQHAA